VPTIHGTNFCGSPMDPLLEKMKERQTNPAELFRRRLRPCSRF
jgi:hypothetical protein